MPDGVLQLERGCSHTLAALVTAKPHDARISSQTAWVPNPGPPRVNTR